MNSNKYQLLLSLDYELFFGQSGSVEKCLFEPSDALVSLAQARGLKPTFFVDAGMLVTMKRLQAGHPDLQKINRQVTEHLARLASRGCEIQLHVHPHWEDSRWTENGWDFEGSRYQFNRFSDMEIADIFAGYASCLEEITGTSPNAYRAGGFCVEPFSRISGPLLAAGVDIDSSVVPGACLLDKEKSFDFRQAPAGQWWFFNDSPLASEHGGKFLEIPVTGVRQPATFYWGRLADRFIGRQGGSIFGNGSSKKIGRQEIIRRLAGISRTTELSIDHAKFRHLDSDWLRERPAGILHFMGHPKLLSKHSLKRLDDWLEKAGDFEFESIASLARRIRSGELGNTGE